jgi:hypothetical protein
MSRRVRPSPAMLVAVIALVAALAGSATALKGKNKVDKNDIRRNAVQGKQVKDDTLKGADVDEATLGQVPSAATAGAAERSAGLEGLARIAPVTISDNAPETSLATLGPFTIALACIEAGTSTTAQLRIRTSENDTIWRSGSDSDANLDVDSFGTLAEVNDPDSPDSPMYAPPAQSAFGAIAPSRAALDGALHLIADGAPGLGGTCTAWGQVTRVG